MCRRFNIKTAFKSGMTLRAHLSRVKDKIPIYFLYSLELWERVHRGNVETVGAEDERASGCRKVKKEISSC